MTDLLTFGETMLRFSPPDDERLETARRYDVRPAGAESNVAVAAARLGLDTAWASKLPASPLGRRVVSELRGHGVDPLVTWSDGGRQGLYFLERGPEPRRTTVIYDRTDAAVTTFAAEEFPTARIRGAGAVFTSGITPALSPTLLDTTRDALATARDNGVMTVLDVNYRSKLWSPAEARRVLAELFDLVDVLLIAERDAATVFDRSAGADAAASLAGDYGLDLTVLTQGSDGALAYTDDGIYETPAFAAEDAYSVGTGDAFAGGFLARYLQGDSVSRALEFGAATAALKLSMPGDFAAVTAEEVRQLVEEDHDGIAR